MAIPMRTQKRVWLAVGVFAGCCFLFMLTMIGFWIYWQLNR